MNRRFALILTLIAVQQRTGRNNQPFWCIKFRSMKVNSAANEKQATRDDDAEKNRLCPPTPYGNSMADWARMNVLGARAATSFSAEPLPPR